MKNSNEIVYLNLNDIKISHIEEFESTLNWEKYFNEV